MDLAREGERPLGASAGETTAIRIRSAYQRVLEPGETVFDEGDPGDRP